MHDVSRVPEAQAGLVDETHLARERAGRRVDQRPLGEQRGIRVAGDLDPVDEPGREQRYELGAWAAPYGIELSVGSFGALLLLILTGASTLALLAGKASLDQQLESGRQPWFL